MPESSNLIINTRGRITGGTGLIGKPAAARAFPTIQANAMNSRTVQSVDEAASLIFLTVLSGVGLITVKLREKIYS